MNPPNDPSEKPGEEAALNPGPKHPEPEPNPDVANADSARKPELEHPESQPNPNVTNVRPERNPGAGDDADANVVPWPPDACDLASVQRKINVIVRVSLEPKTVLMQDWNITTDWCEINGVVVPFYMLSGRVFGHPKHTDGDLIKNTSAITKYEDHTVWTLSGTIYRLGRPHRLYCKRRPNFDQHDPLKGLKLELLQP
jgi:hypothetical protein